MPNNTSKWIWVKPTGEDVIGIKDLTACLMNTEQHEEMAIDELTFMRNVTQAIVNQFYNPMSEFVMVAKNQHGTIIAWCWMQRGHRWPWSDQEQALLQMAQLDPACSLRSRIALLSEMIQLWEQWCESAGIGMVVSNTMRESQQVFLRLHQRAGYHIRGSWAYKRLGTTQAGLPIP